MPPATTSPSNIRAFVQWRQPSVYAGEDVECIITFKNIARSASREEEDEEDEVQTPLATDRNHAPSLPHSRKTSNAQSIKPVLSRAPSVARLPSRGHKPRLSLNVVTAPSKSNGLHSAPLPLKTAQSAGRGHGRSLSIMSLNSESPRESRTPTTAALPVSKRPGRGGHGRSASMQQVSKHGQSQATVGLGLGLQTSRQPSPLYESFTPTTGDKSTEQLPARPGRRRPGTVSANNTPQLGVHTVPHIGSQADGVFGNDFSFPAQRPVGPNSPSPKLDRTPLPSRSPSMMHSAQQRAPIPSPRPADGWSGALGNLNPITRVMSTSSAATGETSRNSMQSDIYSTSNHSDETLTSELPFQIQLRRSLLPALPPSRLRQSNSGNRVEPETLMMASAQIQGTFTLDGSLVNAAPFEPLKRRGAQTAGGVVGLEQRNGSKRASGMFGAFSWGAIGESLGGLLGADEVSSLAALKASAGSKAVPLLSTPQSLLFVNLRLAPGEAKSYKYVFTMPRGLPPTHRGRAMRVQYQLVLGVQRPGNRQTGVKQVEVPFRVLGSYDQRGEGLGHDLMAPYILLENRARTGSIGTTDKSATFAAFSPNPIPLERAKAKQEGLEDFLRYTERLLVSPEDGALLSPTTSPTSPTLSRPQTDHPRASSIRDAVDTAILRSNHVPPSQKGQRDPNAAPNRFAISRAGQPVAVITLLRPAWRLGEAVTGTLDFTHQASIKAVPTYGVRLELETSEIVDATLALRSEASLHRLTRKVHAESASNTLFARRVSFALPIPGQSTPGFETTGVSVGWRVRVGFIVQRGENDQDLLEEVGSDKRGTTSIGKEVLPAESFEVVIPIKVYGVPGMDTGNAEGTEREGWEV